MRITMTPRAYWHLQWMAHRTPCEVSSMGLLAPAREGLLIEDFILVRQTASPASVDLDMNWWAEKQVELYERSGIEPWRTSCWTHTHPAGVNAPSGTDEETMARSFGKWDFALMLILTKADVFYARLDFDRAFGCGPPLRLRALCSIHVDWSATAQAAVTEETLAEWEREFRERVREEHGFALSRRNIQQDEKEMEAYERMFEAAGLDPADPFGEGLASGGEFDPRFR